MNLKPTLALFLFWLASWLTPGAKAMSFDNFARLTNDDKANYVVFLVEAAAQVLKTHGQPDQAGKAIALFKDPGPNGGMHQFASNMQMLNSLNNRNATNPNNRVPAAQIEDVMALTLKGNGIIVSTKDLLASSRSFVPDSPPPQHLIIYR